MRRGSYAGGSGASVEVGPPPADFLDALGRYLRGAAVVAEMEMRKLRHDPTEIFTRAVQPVLWLVVFGQAISHLRAIPTGHVDYLTFMAPGILAQSLMFISIFYGLTIIWDRDQGILQKLLVMPVPRASFVTGKGLGAGVRATSQAVVIFIIALVVGVKFHWSVPGVVGTLVAVVVGASLFSTISMLVAIVLKTRERFMGFGQVITMPLFFASNAIYPVGMMPGWLKALATVNPLSYLVDLLRGYLVSGRVPGAATDWAVLLGVLVLAQVVAARTYRRILI
ncbi:ABC transporter permease [Rubrobacter calidifluminis]|uniref:ABC transporter permease n=1 Tax=Rubrobacter calidifluminis TaxID=1392640 RepID=UPI00235FDD2D|nr:ABC transporter permease [Rubrobacter calidifluminis]